jgi:hypothetical protein
MLLTSGPTNIRGREIKPTIANFGFASPSLLRNTRNFMSSPVLSLASDRAVECRLTATAALKIDLQVVGRRVPEQTAFR